MVGSSAAGKERLGNKGSFKVSDSQIFVIIIAAPAHFPGVRPVSSQLSVTHRKPEGKAAGSGGKGSGFRVGQV